MSRRLEPFGSGGQAVDPVGRPSRHSAKVGQLNGVHGVHCAVERHHRLWMHQLACALLHDVDAEDPRVSRWKISFSSLPDRR